MSACFWCYEVNLLYIMKTLVFHNGEDDWEGGGPFAA